jgi:hypothetical protein
LVAEVPKALGSFHGCKYLSSAESDLGSISRRPGADIVRSVCFHNLSRGELLLDQTCGSPVLVVPEGDFSRRALSFAEVAPERATFM